MFRADVVVVEVAGLFDGVLDDFLGPRRLGQLAHRDHVRPGLDDLLDLQADLAQVDVEVLQDVGGDAGAFLDQAQEDVFGADVLVVEALGLLVGQLHHLASTVREAFIHSSRLRCCLTPRGVLHECAIRKAITCQWFRKRLVASWTISGTRAAERCVN